jgi:5-oxoprolinase (ATP-hydrolysing)
LIKPLAEDSRSDVKLLSTCSEGRVRAELEPGRRPTPSLAAALHAALRRHRHTIPRLDIDLAAARMRADFEAAHKAQFGFVSPGTDHHRRGHLGGRRSTDRIGCTGSSRNARSTRQRSRTGRRQIYAGGKWHDAPLSDRDRLSPA